MTTVPPPAAAAAAIARLIASLSIVTPSPLAPKSRTSKRRLTGGTATTDDGDGDAESVVPAFRVLDAPEQATPASSSDSASGRAWGRANGMRVVSRGGTPRAAGGCAGCRPDWWA